MMNSNLSFDLPEHALVTQPGARHFVLGCDLGQSSDPTALVLVEKVTPPHWFDCRAGERREHCPRAQYHIRHLQRLKLGTSYPMQVAEIADLFGRLPRGSDLIVDRTGVGRAVVDLFEDQGLRPIACSITAGEAERIEGRNVWCAKTQLIGSLIAVFHNEDLRIAPVLAEAKAFVSELSSFRVSYTNSGQMTYGAAGGRHDDLVLATSLAIWLVSSPPRKAFRTTTLGLF